MRKRSIENHGNRRWFEADIERLVEMRRSNMTLEQISLQIGVTRARVWQLVGKRKFCRSCRTESVGDLAWRGPACPNCLREARRKSCRNPVCGEAFVPVVNQRTLYCPKCRWTSRSCFCGCGKVIVRPRRKYNTERLRWFHSHKAWGEWKRETAYDWRLERRDDQTLKLSPLLPTKIEIEPDDLVSLATNMHLPLEKVSDIFSARQNGLTLKETASLTGLSTKRVNKILRRLYKGVEEADEV